MKDIDIERIFDIIKKEYGVFLSNEKIALINELDYQNIIRLTKEKSKVSISGDYYLNFDMLDYDLIILLCLSILCGKLNPLKIELIKLESLHIKSLLNLDNSNEDDLMIARIIKEKVLADVPFNVIFLESDVDIFDYLTEEKDLKTAKFYYEISKLMLSIYRKNGKEEFNLLKYLQVRDSLNYDLVYDKLYNFVSKKVM